MKTDTGNFCYRGREFNSSHDEVLDCHWMNANKMRKQWRRNNLRGPDNRFLGQWVKIPVGKVKTTSSISSPKSTPIKTPLNPCVAGALYRFSKCMNLRCQDKMFTLMKESPTFGMSVTAFAKCRGFHPIKSKGSFNIIEDTVPDHVYLVQISARFKNSFDNSHCIVVYNGKIFDINHSKPLSLTRDNLDLCCVGDGWMFSHISRKMMFLPTKDMKQALNTCKCQC